MKDQTMQEKWEESYLFNTQYVEGLYENYLQDPSSVDQQWHDFFAQMPESATDQSHEVIKAHFEKLAKSPKHLQGRTVTPQHEYRQSQVAHMINAYRSYGHLNANIDPLGIMQRGHVNSLDKSHYGFTAEDDAKTFSAGNFDGIDTATLKDIHASLQNTYCSSVGYEYMHIASTSEREWIQKRIEQKPFEQRFTSEDKINLLKDLVAADTLEQFLGNRFVGVKRFSLEGGDSLIPMLNDIIQRAGGTGVKECVVGMPHRGRLNVLVNTFGKNVENIINEFEGKGVSTETTGDVKYHLGYSSDIQTSKEIVHASLAFNPSHLEFVAPVVEGSVRARQRRRKDLHIGAQVLPVLIHGDAAFAGQGIVMETFTLSQVRGYATGGSIHIVVNNQVGFTTNPEDSRSTEYCTDIAKMVDAPIFHVNSDDPLATLFVTQMALDYRLKFKKDVVIDLVCFRRHGHQEVDEPTATQPTMYQVVKKHPRLFKLYSEQLIGEGIINKDQVNTMVAQYHDGLNAGDVMLKSRTEAIPSPFDMNWDDHLTQDWRENIRTGVDKKHLLALANKLDELNASVNCQPQVGKMMKDRAKMTSGEIPMNWGYAETLAYATLLTEGTAVRISGQDAQRGTFSHRHAVLHDYKNDDQLTPLENLTDDQAHCIIINSILSEQAVLGFEYGFACSSPETLVIWEAQFGDFANGAQVIIDQFISSAEQKWSRFCGLVMLLPHGYEGMGPEHSSARLERYLQLCAQENMQVCIPTTPAQIFHVMRRQMLRKYRKPLVIMSPKSMLRNKLAVSNFDELVNGSFQNVIGEHKKLNAKTVDRVVLCSGKVYYDLLEKRDADKLDNAAIVRVEQMYPFPDDDFKAALDKFPNAKTVVWCQEEPKNQGAWYCIQNRLQSHLTKNQTLLYAGRTATAAPAVGYAALHKQEQAQLVIDAFTVK